MNNNEILKKIKIVFSLGDAEVVEIYNVLEKQVTVDQVQSWTQKHEDPKFSEMADVELCTFLNALICEKRGKKDGPQPIPEKRVSNNIIVKKLKIALNLKNEDIAEVLKSVGVAVNNYELTSYFRKPDHKNYRSIKGSFLRDFFKGLELRKSSL